MSAHAIRAYLKFLWHSKNHYGVHSPFVYDLLARCIYDRTYLAGYETLRAFRKSLLEDHRAISVTDFGAGSKVFRSGPRKISAIAENAGISERRARLLLRMSGYFKPGHVLEIGTSLGLATSALSLGNPQGKIVTLEGCPETAAVAESRFRQFGLRNIKLAVGEFAQTLTHAGMQDGFGLVYFDGNHRKEATLQYVEALLPMAANDSVWIFDDIHWSAEMESAWEIIKRNPAVTVTIDTFQWGLVFFRQEQRKEHFVLRT